MDWRRALADAAAGRRLEESEVRTGEPQLAPPPPPAAEAVASAWDRAAGTCAERPWEAPPPSSMAGTCSSGTWERYRDAPVACMAWEPQERLPSWQVEEPMEEMAAALTFQRRHRRLALEWSLKKKNEKAYSMR